MATLGPLLRSLALIFLIALGAVWVAPHWDRDSRTLTLRLRDTDELFVTLRRAARALGEQVVDVASDEEKRKERVAPVSSGKRSAAPKSASPPAERLTREDRAGLDQLVEERLGH
jgi:hypothetical protein